jgi:hypothetical protein
MGRSIRASFDACRVVAMRNANVYFDMTDTSAEHDEARLWLAVL